MIPTPEKERRMSWFPSVTTTVLLLLPSLLLTSQKPVKDRGVEAVDENLNFSTGRLLLAVIGIDNYIHWQKLDNAVSDALGLQQALVDKAGFTVPVEPLLNEQATKPAIMSFIEDRLREEIQPNDQLVLFFAGHGHTRVSRVGDSEVETGYLVPVDAPIGQDEKWAEYVRIEHFLDAVNELPARHVLVVLDACHSGFALGEAVKKSRGAEEFQRQLSEKVSRRAITSAQRDQLASDSGPLPDHSLFTGSFVDGLTWGTMDIDANGLITSSEIGLYLQQVVGQATNSKQTPDFGAFGLDDRGELVISLRNQSFSALVARATSALHNGRNTEFSEILRKLEATGPNRSEALYLKYRAGLLSGDVDGAIEAVAALTASPLNPGAIPLGPEDLWDIRQQLPFWRAILELEESSAELEVDVVVRGTSTKVVPQLLGEVEAYRLSPEAIYQLRITNKAQEKRFVQVFLVSEAGRMKPMRIWQEFGPMFEGLEPGGTLESMPLQKSGAAGVEELRLIVSSQAINELVIPPDPKARGISGLSRESSDAIASSKRHTVRLVVIPDVPVAN
jgi:Caspase domain